MRRRASRADRHTAFSEVDRKIIFFRKNVARKHDLFYS